MKLNPRYDGPLVVSMDETVADPAVAVTRQRRRMESLLAGLSPEQWEAASRCDGWTVRDVVAHLVTVNEFWTTSVQAGLAGEPTRMLAHFDPQAHPPMLVESLGPLSGAEVLERFSSTNDALLALIADLDAQQWQQVAEAPVGHLAIARVMDHGLWDAWVHERDIAVPLGLPVADEPDELAAALRYVAALGPAILAGRPESYTGRVQVAATDPHTVFVVDAGAAMVVHEGPSADRVPCLEGRAADLLEALSLRAPLPADAPAAWHEMIAGLQAAFDA